MLTQQHHRSSFGERRKLAADQQRDGDQRQQRDAQSAVRLYQRMELVDRRHDKLDLVHCQRKFDLHGDLYQLNRLHQRRDLHGKRGRIHQQRKLHRRLLDAGQRSLHQQRRARQRTALGPA